ncbi:MAG TPA: hypothetical protein VN661_01580 [Candidatus Acidoferrales bacterium]|nr:hypothetical protein [Candidatus Acidoferrales bacterium]
MAAVYSRAKASSVWSIADQGSVSLGNFLTNILLARTVIPTEYGIFALLYGLIVVLNSFHSSVVTYPLAVQGAIGDCEDLRRHLRGALLFTLCLSVPFAAVIIAATFALKVPHLAPEAIAALLCWEVQETLRRALMAHLRHREAVLGDACSYIGQAGAIYICIANEQISLSQVFIIIALTSGIAAVFQLIQLGSLSEWMGPSTTSLEAFWSLGKWAALANTGASLSAAVFPWVLALRSVSDTASFQALINVASITNPVMLGIGNLIVPATTRTTEDGGIGRAWHKSSRYAIEGAVVLLPCYCFMFARPEFLLTLLYGHHSPYHGLGPVLRLLVFAYGLMYVAHVLTAFFYGLRDSKGVVRAQMTGFAAVVLAGLPLTLAFGVLGASLGLALGYAVQVCSFIRRLRRRMRTGMAAMASAYSQHG